MFSNETIQGAGQHRTWDIQLYVIRHAAGRTLPQYLVNRGQLCSHRPGMESGAVPESPRGPLPATVQHPARRLLPVQGPGRRLVPSELGAALPVAVWGAGLSMQAVVAAGARGQTLGDVLCVGGRASLTGTTVQHTAETSKGLFIFIQQQ